MVSIGSRINDEMTVLAVDLMRVSESARKKIIPLLKGLERELVDTIREYELAGVSRTSAQFARAERMLAQARMTITSGYKTMHKQLQNELVEISAATVDSTKSILNNTLQASLVDTVIPRNELRKIADNTMIKGAVNKEWWGKQSRNLKDRFTQQVRQGLVAGESVDDIVRRVRGTWTGKYTTAVVRGVSKKVPLFEGGIMDVTTREANALVRTAVQTVSGKVMEQVYKDNDDVIGGMMAIVTLDLRTSDICIGRSGGMWDMEGKPLPESAVDIPYPGPPPWHWNCRTALGPITKTWEQLIEESSGKKMKIEEIPPSVRASMDGPVPASFDYEKFLMTRSKSDQMEMLGPTKYDLWSNGKLTLAETLDQSGNPLGARALAEKYSQRRAAPARFEKKVDAANELARTTDPSGAIPGISKPIEVGQVFTTEAPNRIDIHDEYAATWSSPRTWLSKVDAGHTEMMESAAKVKGVSPTFIEDKVNTVLQTFAAEAKTIVRVNKEVLGDIAKSGRLKNQFEVGRAGAGLPGLAARKEAEKSLFNLAEGISKKKRPVYGFLTKNPGKLEKSLLEFGDVQIVLKDAVKGRSTMSIGDLLTETQLGKRPAMAAVPVNAPTYHGLRTGTDLGRISARTNLEKLGGHVEAHIFGGVRISDIESIYLPRGVPLDVQDQLRSLGIKLKRVYE